MRNSIDEIYGSYVTDVKRYLLSLTSNHHVTEDLLQETFLRAYLHIENCPTEHIKPWLFKIARNVYLDLLKKKKPIIMEDAFFETVKDTELVEGILLTKEQAVEVHKALESLPDKQKQAIQLIYFSELSYGEAAQVMDISLANVKITVFRGKQLLRKQIERVFASE